MFQDGAWAVELLLSVDRPIRDLSFLSLSWEEGEQEFRFVTQELGSLAE